MEKKVVELPSDTDGTEVPDTFEENIAEDERPFPLKLIFVGLLLISSFIGFFSAWTVIAPIESAVVSPGIVSVASHRKQIQHLEGGIVEDILVRDGDHVKQGQVLIKLRDVRQTSELRQLERRHIEVQGVIARLLAERDGKAQIEFPEELLTQAEKPLVSSVVTGQENIFRTRIKLVHDKLSVLEHKIAQKKEEINGLAGQIEAKKRERDLLKKELATIQKAAEKNLVPKSEGLKLQQRLAQIDGDLIEYQAEIERTQQNILEIQVHMSEAQAQRISDITEELRSQRALFYELSQKIIAVGDVLQRTEIVSPIDGIVVNLQVHTADGVIAAGQPLLEVVPAGDKLVVYAYIDPNDIDEVRIGMPADVKLTSISRRMRVPLEGVVANLSADRLSGSQKGTSYYQARIELNPDSDALESTRMIAGMGAQVFIRTGSRTPLDYLLAPITRSLQLGLKEQ